MVHQSGLAQPSATESRCIALAIPHVAQQRAPTASPVASAAAGEASPGKTLKKPRHVPRPGATQPTLPVRSPAESPRPAAAAPKKRANKVPAHYMRSCVLMQVRLTRLLQAKQGALAGIKKKKSQTGKNRDRCVRVLRVARVRVGHSEFAGATRSLRLSLLWNVANGLMIAFAGAWE